MNAPLAPPRPRLSGSVELSHGGGGRAMVNLIRSIFAHHFANPILAQAHDAACIDVAAGRIAITTDAHVVAPLFFPGGDIGSLAVHGTVNDLAMAGAQPLALTVAFIIEEGFPIAQLDAIAQSMGDAAREAGVPIATGDTKVVERGKGDGVFIATSGIGVVPAGVDIGPHRLAPDQAILLSGTIGDHGVAILSQRQGLDFGTTILSDSAALHQMVAAMLAVDPQIAVLRDPTRGGVSATMNELASAGGVGILLDEAAIPVRGEVAAACELLGLDPLHIANEGKLICICAADRAEAVLAAMRSRPEGVDAAQIGVTTANHPGFVQMTTRIGGKRVIDWLSGEQLPRIC